MVGVIDTIIHFNTYENGLDAKGNRSSSSAQVHHIVANPNPTTGWTTFNWDLTGYTQIFVLSGYTGEVVANYDVDAQSVSHQVDMTNFGNGPYYIRLEGNNLPPLTGQFMKTTE